MRPKLMFYVSLEEVPGIAGAGFSRGGPFVLIPGCLTSVFAVAIGAFELLADGWPWAPKFTQYIYRAARSRSTLKCIFESSSRRRKYIAFSSSRLLVGGRAMSFAPKGEAERAVLAFGSGVVVFHFFFISTFVVWWVFFSFLLLSLWPIVSHL